MSHHDITRMERVREIGEGILDMLEEKNKSYGDNISNPINVFSGLPPEEGLKVRIDDKLSRIARGNSYQEDNVRDLVGYLLRYIEMKD